MMSKDEYDKALKDVDILVMPTIAAPPPNLGDDSTRDDPVIGSVLTRSIVYNTCPFDCKLPLGVYSGCQVMYSASRRTD